MLKQHLAPDLELVKESDESYNRHFLIAAGTAVRLLFCCAKGMRTDGIPDRECDFAPSSTTIGCV